MMSMKRSSANSEARGGAPFIATVYLRLRNEVHPGRRVHDGGSVRREIQM